MKRRDHTILLRLAHPMAYGKANLARKHSKLGTVIVISDVKEGNAPLYEAGHDRPAKRR